MRRPNERDDRDEGFRARSAPGAVGATISAHAARRLGTSRIERFEIDELPDGERTITRDVPRSTVGHLDERGLARVGRRVTPGAILIGAVRTTGGRSPAVRGPEEGLLRAIFRDDLEDVSLRAPAEADGEVVEAVLEGEPGTRRTSVVVRIDRPLSVGDLVERNDGATAVVIAIDPELDVDALWPAELTPPPRAPNVHEDSVRVLALRRTDAARDVLHARSIGPYSTYTLQPLAGKPSFGGQRIGRAELTSLFERGAWGLAHELVTVKSDDVEGRVRLYESIVRGDPGCPATRPEAAAMLLAYLRACGLEVDEEADEPEPSRSTQSAPPKPVDVVALFAPKDAPVPRALTLRFATTDDVRAQSHGSVIRPDLRDEHGVPVMGGLLCPRLFGPFRDYECECGALEGLRHRGTRCRECGVEILRSSVRRRRFAHVPLAAPVLHPLAFDLVATLLAVSSARLHAVLGYETTLAGDEPATGASLTTKGAPAIAAALATLDLAALSREDGARGANARALVAAGRRPESLVVEAWPVLPADLRPSNPKSRTITEALNDLYVRLVNRNQRLARLRELNAPEIILRNEARMLQRAVDALVENGRREEPVARDGEPLRSLLHFLADPHGLVVQQLASKRVDYSAIAVAVPSDVPRGRVRMPREAMRELLRPAIFGELEAEGHATSIKGAKALVDADDPRADAALDALLTRAPLVAFPFPEDRAPTRVFRSPTPLALEVECSDGSVCAQLSAEDLRALELAPGGRVMLFLPIDPRAVAEARELLGPTAAAPPARTPLEDRLPIEGWLADIVRPIGVPPTRARLARAASRAERDPLVDRFARLVLGLPPSGSDR